MVKSKYIKSIVLLLLVIFCVEFSVQKYFVQTIKNVSLVRMQECKQIILSKAVSYSNESKIEGLKEGYQCLESYVIERNATANKRVSTYFYAIVTFILILLCSTIVRIFKKYKG